MKRPRAPLLPTLLITSALALALSASPARSATATPDPPPTKDNAPNQDADKPVLLNAATLVYDDKAQTVTADGGAELYYKGQIVRADRLIYDRGQDIVTAEGNVRIWQDSGDVVFADHAVLSRDMRQGFVEQVALLMTDDSRFVAAEGERTEGRYVRMNRALYTACNVCRENPDKPPLWQVRADRIIHDNVRHDVIYRNATLELGGVPIFYTPYLSHPDPTVKRRSGFLAPIIGTRSNLGFVSRNYYYLDVAPSMDATIEGSYSEKHGTLIGGEWRQRFANGRLQVNASATQDSIPDDAGGPDDPNQLRGHLFVDGDYTFNPNWRASLSLRRTTDDTYTDLWSFTSDDILTSRAQVDYATARTSGVVEAISFQDLRSDITAAEPQVVHANWTTQSEPHSLMGGRWTLGADTRGISRSHGLDSTRASLAAGWRRDDILPTGFVVTSELTARMDGFAARDLSSTNDEASTVRLFAQGQITTRWPFVRPVTTGQQFLEPVAQLSVAPRQKRDPDDIANEDSIGLEFDPTNLFQPNRYAGYDRLDGGQRVVYGLRGGWMGTSGASVTAALGQSHDLASHPNYPDGSGLETQNSDIVGSVSALVPGWTDLAYSVRLDNATYDPREHDLRMNVGPGWLQGSVSYLYAEQSATDPLASPTRQEVTVGSHWTFLPHWTISGSHRHDLERSDGALASSVNLVYQDECLTFSLIAQRDHVARSGLDSGDSIFFRLIFRNIGEFESPNLSTDVFGGQES